MPYYRLNLILVLNIVIPCSFSLGGERRRCKIEGNDLTEDFLVNTGDIGIEIEGKIYCCGRKNRIVKRNGQLVSLDRLEQFLEKEFGFMCHSIYKMNQLKTYIKISNNTLNNQHQRLDILQSIRDKLPKRYLPEGLYCVDHFPTTQHGKIDEQKLVVICEGITSSITDLHSILITAWNFALGRKNAVTVGDCDNFINCGGDSFSAVLLMNELLTYELFNKRKNFNQGIFFELIFSGTFRALYEYVQSDKMVLSSPKLQVQYPTKSKVKVDTLMSPACHHFRAFTKSNITYDCVCGTVYLKRLEDDFISNHFHVREKWKYDTGKCIDASPLVVFDENHDGIVYVGSHSQQFFALRSEDGQEIWKTKVEDRIESSAAITKDGKFICFGEFFTRG